MFWGCSHATESIWPFTGTYKAYNYEKKIEFRARIPPDERLTIPLIFLASGETFFRTSETSLSYYSKIGKATVMLYTE